MKIISTIALCFTIAFAFAQEKGVNFQNNLTWAQIKEKAKTENKYIFVDCYTTWCVPCKVMAKEILPQPEVASFLNDKFISIALQFDKTKQDDANVKRWYKDVKLIDAVAKVNAYPTYLIYDHQGQLIGRVVGASPDAKTFLDQVKNELDPKTQLANLKKEYKAGNRSSEFLLTFINAFKSSWDNQANEVMNVYLSRQKNLLTKDNLLFVRQATGKSTDPGFKVLREHSKEFDAVYGPGKSLSMISNIVFDELILTMVRNNGKRVNNGGMYYYTGEINKNVDWAAVRNVVKVKYGDLTDDIVDRAKLQNLRDREDWPEYTKQVQAFVNKHNDVAHADDISTYLNYIFLFTDDKSALEGALNIARQVIAIDGDNKQWYQMVYANLLYKLGRKEDALAVTNDGIKRFGDKAYALKELQEKINKNEKNW